jgi:hypothetical protein
MRCTSILMTLAMIATLAGAARAQTVSLPSAPSYPIETAKQTPAHTPRAQKPAVAPTAPEHTATAAQPKRAKPVANIPLPPPAPQPKTAKIAPTKITPVQTAQAQPAPTQTANTQAAAATPTTDPLASIPAEERLKIRQQLFWSGDYGDATDGDDPTTAAIKKFQKRNKTKITGTLTDEQRAELVAAADRHADEFGWRVVLDPATGIRIGLPTKLVPNAHDAAHGTRWSSAHNEVSVETFRVKDANLAALYEQERKKAKRSIERSTLDDDGFYISGMQGLKYFAVRAKRRDGEVRGFTILFDQMMEGIVAPVAVAIASAFSPFPQALAPLAALENKVEYGTGLIVSAEGHILTARKVARDCQVIVADGLGNAERVAEDEAHGLALLRVYGAGRLPVLPLPRAAPSAGDITLIGIPDPKEQNGAKQLKEIQARLTNDKAIQLHQPVPTAGFPGAAALDAQGRFIGVMETRNFVLASADPGVPPLRLVPAAAIRDFLTSQHVALPEGESGDARKAAIRVICVRK